MFTPPPGDCKATYGDPLLKGLHHVTTEGDQEKVDDDYDGYQLEWTSEKDCDTDSS